MTTMDQGTKMPHVFEAADDKYCKHCGWEENNPYHHTVPTRPKFDAPKRYGIVNFEAYITRDDVKIRARVSLTQTARSYGATADELREAAHFLNQLAESIDGSKLTSEREEKLADRTISQAEQISKLVDERDALREQLRAPTPQPMTDSLAQIAAWIDSNVSDADKPYPYTADPTSNILETLSALVKALQASREKIATRQALQSPRKPGEMAPNSYDDVYAQAVKLAQALHDKHYSMRGNNKLLMSETLSGVLDQIDNMTSGLVQQTRYNLTIFARSHKGRIIDITTSQETVNAWNVQGFDFRPMSCDEVMKMISAAEPQPLKVALDVSELYDVDNLRKFIVETVNHTFGLPIKLTGKPADLIKAGYTQNDKGEWVKPVFRPNAKTTPEEMIANGYTKDALGFWIHKGSNEAVLIYKPSVNPAGALWLTDKPETD